MLTLRFSRTSERFDCYKNGDYVSMWTCSVRFNLYYDDEYIPVAGRIEHHNVNRYYFICHEGYATYLYNGMLGTLSWVSFCYSWFSG